VIQLTAENEDKSVASLQHTHRDMVEHETRKSGLNRVQLSHSK